MRKIWRKEDAPFQSIPGHLGVVESPGMVVVVSIEMETLVGARRSKDTLRNLTFERRKKVA